MNAAGPDQSTEVRDLEPPGTYSLIIPTSSKNNSLTYPSIESFSTPHFPMYCSAIATPGAQDAHLGHEKEEGNRMPGPLEEDDDNFFFDEPATPDHMMVTVQWPSHADCVGMTVLKSSAL